MSGVFRLGVSSSAFVRTMPPEIVQAMQSNVREGVPRKLDSRLNRMMVDFTRGMMQAINASDIATLECYHSTIWDCDDVLEPILDNPNVEFWSVHAPYGRMADPSSPDVDIRAAAKNAYCAGVDAAEKLGAGRIVAHPGANRAYDVPKQLRMGYTADIITEVADYAGERGIKVAVEPLPKQEVGNSLEEVFWILDKVDRPNVGINFDVNHLFPASAVPELITKAGDRIFSVHISDQDDNERHWLPFEGKLDWQAVLSALHNTGYQGPLIYETHVPDVTTCEEAAAKVVENYGRLIQLAPAEMSVC
ncbi:MAG: sugar phosphate isomerase/epimerase family protein [Armatimonadota bacterium]|nr:sugar phosphate isomerase/epimerase [bacterium]